MSLAVKAVRGAFWTVGMGLGARLCGLVGSLILTRFLAPAQFGKVSAATVVVLLANQVSVFGFGQYVIAHPKAGRDVAFHATLFHLTFGAVGLAAILVARDWLGPLFGVPDLGHFIPGLALAILIERIGFMPERVLYRDMRFRVAALSRAASELTYTAVSVGLAWADCGPMAIVVANLARYSLFTLLVLAAVDRRDWLAPCAIDRRTTFALFRFGWPLWLAGFTGLAARKADNLLVSRFFGESVLGSYNYAYNLADTPASFIGEQIGDVLLPSFAHLDSAQRPAGLMRSTRLLGLLIFPLAIGLAAIAPTLVAAVFDPRWAAVAPMLLVLSALSVTRPLGWAVSSFLQACGRTRAVMALEVLKLCTMLVAVGTFGRLSPLWTCGAVGLAFGSNALASLAVAQVGEGVPMGRLLLGLLPPLAACVPMVAAILGVRHQLESFGFGTGWPALGIELATGAVVYVIAALVVARETSRDFIGLCRRALGR
ncbi:MAG: oligosaccharyltransferase [Myxococcales bacterium]|nr:oligosaccharyltransferase [Myxococcales bacterium]